MPAKFTIASLIILVSKLFFAYSFKYIAAQTPIGRVIAIAHVTIKIVPSIAGRIPPPRIPSLGIDAKNSQVIADAPFFMITKIIVPTGITDKTVARKRIVYESF
jgi:hypothetical protein